MNPGNRVVVDWPEGERTYATVVDEGSRPETIMLDVDGRYYNPQEHWRERVKPAIAARDMVIGDLLNLAMLKEALEVEFIGTLWTDGDSGPMTPYVCECSFGDGLKLIKIFTINQRPNYHVVRVDSGWNESNWHDGDTIGEHIDDVLTAIEEECGRAGDCLDEPCDNCGDTCCKCREDFSSREAFPELDGENGCSWGKIDWRWLMRKIGVSQ
jgi:hypothetical protein